MVLVLLLPSASIAQTAPAQPAAEEAVKFYQSLKKAPSELETCSLVFGEKLRLAVGQGSQDNVAQMKIALMDVYLTLHRLKTEAKALKAVDSSSGKELAAAVDRYLKQQEQAIAESGPEMIRLAADGSLTPGEKAVRLQAVIERNRKTATSVEGPLTKAFMAFALEHDLVGEPTVELHEFMPPDKSCKVMMPDLTENKTTDRNGVKNTYFLAEHKNGVFMLSYADIAAPGEEEAALQKRLLDARAGVVSKLNLKVTREAALTLADRHPGRELEGNLPDNTFARIRVFLANGRIYQVWVVGNPRWAVSPEATRFLRSLAILK
jgi:hypothetical protein